jgi:hypothetical protein
MNRYHNLTEMLAVNHAAHAYFDGLPDYIRQMIAERGDNVHSPDELQGYAEKLLRGDD